MLACVLACLCMCGTCVKSEVHENSWTHCTHPQSHPPSPKPRTHKEQASPGQTAHVEAGTWEQALEQHTSANMGEQACASDQQPAPIPLLSLPAHFISSHVLQFSSLETVLAFISAYKATHNLSGMLTWRTGSSCTNQPRHCKSPARPG